MKTIIVTKENMDFIRAFQGTPQTKVCPGLILFESEKFKDKDIVFLTDWKPSVNSLRMIARANDAEAIKYGWDDGARITQLLIDERSETSFNRYTITFRAFKTRF